MTLVDAVRDACAHVAAEARWLRIEEDSLEPYARSFPTPAADLGPDPEIAVLDGPVEDRAAFALTLDAVNFGSGWWPEIRKRPGRSGFATMALGLRERFDAKGPWPADELAWLCKVTAERHRQSRPEAASRPCAAVRAPVATLALACPGCRPSTASASRSIATSASARAIASPRSPMSSRSTTKARRTCSIPTPRRPRTSSRQRPTAPSPRSS